MAFDAHAVPALQHEIHRLKNPALIAQNEAIDRGQLRKIDTGRLTGDAAYFEHSRLLDLVEALERHRVDPELRALLNAGALPRREKALPFQQESDGGCMEQRILGADERLAMAEHRRIDPRAAQELRQ